MRLYKNSCLDSWQVTIAARKPQLHIYKQCPPKCIHVLVSSQHSGILPITMTDIAASLKRFNGLIEDTKSLQFACSPCSRLSIKHVDVVAASANITLSGGCCCQSCLLTCPPVFHWKNLYCFPALAKAEFEPSLLACNNVPAVVNPVGRGHSEIMSSCVARLSSVKGCFLYLCNIQVI